MVPWDHGLQERGFEPLRIAPIVLETIALTARPFLFVTHHNRLGAAHRHLFRVNGENFRHFDLFASQFVTVKVDLTLRRQIIGRCQDAVL